MSTTTAFLRRLPLAHAAHEFTLTTVLLFLAVTVVRWLRDPGSPLCIADLNVALGVIGAVSGAILTGLILSPLGRRSGGHTNPAVTVALWLMAGFPGRRVLPYALAQLAGSVAGAGLARLVWGQAVTLPSVSHAAIRPAPGWEPAAVFLAEAGGMMAVILVVGFFLVHHGLARWLPHVIGLSVATVIAVLGPLSGGSINPARQLGPAVLSGQTLDLWIYLVAPVLGAALGAAVHHLLSPRFYPRRPRPHDVGDPAGAVVVVRRSPRPAAAAAGPAPAGPAARGVPAAQRGPVVPGPAACPDPPGLSPAGWPPVHRSLPSRAAASLDRK